MKPLGPLLLVPAVIAALAALIIPSLLMIRRCHAAPPPTSRPAAAAGRVKPTLDCELHAAGLQLGDPVFIRIFKEERELELWVRHRSDGTYRHFRTWPVVAMSGTLGPKLAEGDLQAPEGFYFVPPDRMKPDSLYHLAFNLGFPNAFDCAHGRTGSLIMVHGNRVSIGCFAMTDEKIEEIYTLCEGALSNGQPFFRVHVFPFRMTSERMSAAAAHPWHDFWLNLKEGYDWFENTRIPPEATVKDGRYAFGNP